MARTLAFTYASLVIGAGQSGTTYRLTGKHSFSHDYERASLSFEVVVQSDTIATFLSAEATLLAAYRTQDAALTVVLSGTTRHTFDPAASANTGFNARASARLVPGEDSTERSARYACSVVVELPAPTTGRAGRRSSSVDVSTGPSGRRTLTVTGVYTAQANATARAQFAAQVDTYCNAIVTGLTGTWQLSGTPGAIADDQNKTIQFTRKYEEVIHAASKTLIAAAPALRNPRLTVRQTKTAVESFATTEPLREVVAEFSASVWSATSTDLTSLWEDTVRPAIVAEVERIASATDGGTVAIVRESPLYELSENAVSASMTFMVSAGLLRQTIQITDEVDAGVILKPVWNGDPLARDVYQGPSSHVRIVSQTVLSTTRPTIGARAFGGFIPVRKSEGVREWQIGLPGSSLTMHLVQARHVYVRANAVGGGGAGAGGGGSTTRSPGGGGGAAGGGDGAAGGGGGGGAGGGGNALGIFGIGAGGLSLDFGSSFGIFGIDAGAFALDFDGGP